MYPTKDTFIPKLYTDSRRIMKDAFLYFGLISCTLTENGYLKQDWKNLVDSFAKKDLPEYSVIKMFTEVDLINFLPSTEFIRFLQNYCKDLNIDFTARFHIESSFTLLRSPQNIVYKPIESPSFTQTLVAVRAMNRSSKRAIKNCFKIANNEDERHQYFKKKIALHHLIYPSADFLVPIKFTESISSGVIKPSIASFVRVSRTSKIHGASTYAKLVDEIYGCLIKLNKSRSWKRNFKDQDFGWWVLLAVHGHPFYTNWPKFGNKPEPKNSQDPQIEYGCIDLVMEVMGLLFIVEAQRSPASIIYSLMMLDIMFINKNFKWQHCFHSSLRNQKNAGGGYFPMSLSVIKDEDTKKDATTVSSSRKLLATIQSYFFHAKNRNYFYEGPIGTDEDWIQVLIQRETNLIQEWFNTCPGKSVGSNATEWTKKMFWTKLADLVLKAVNGEIVGNITSTRLFIYLRI